MMGPVHVPDDLPRVPAELADCFDSVLGQLAKKLEGGAVFAKFVDQEGHVGDLHRKSVARMRERRSGIHIWLRQPSGGVATQVLLKRRYIFR